MRIGKLEAKLLFIDETDALARVDVQALRDVFGAMGHSVLCLGDAENEHVTLTLNALRISIRYRAAPVPLRLFRGVTRPAETEAERKRVLRCLARHRSSLSVTVADRSQKTVIPDPIKRRLVWEVVDHLLTLGTPELVLCPGQDRLMTAEETEDWLGGLDERLPLPHPGALPPPDPRKDLFAKAPQMSGRAAQWLAEGQDIGADTDILGAPLRNFLHTRGETEIESTPRTATGRSALYVMSAAIGVFALPIGAYALAYNALSGGSLRITAQAMAATGVFSAADTAGWTGQALRMVGLG